MKKLLALCVAASLVAAVPSFAADPPYKIPPGQYCKGVSKKHIPGQRGTPFSQCVTAMAKLNKKPSTAPSQACAGLKKAKGSKNKAKANKAFKQCVQAGKKLKLDNANAYPPPFAEAGGGALGAARRVSGPFGSPKYLILGMSGIPETPKN
jgi:hypothetical protein